MHDGKLDGWTGGFCSNAKGEMGPELSAGQWCGEQRQSEGISGQNQQGLQGTEGWGGVQSDGQVSSLET